LTVGPNQAKILRMTRPHVPAGIRRLYEVHDYRHASAILKVDFPREYNELCEVLETFRFTEQQVRQPGGSESEIPKQFTRLLHPKGWDEKQLTAKLVVDDAEVVMSDTHKIDFIKNCVAFDLEWNSKDQTFDRDLYAFRAFFEFNKISVGVLVTRSNELQEYFESLGEYTDRYGTVRRIAAKYGASTTHMAKLLPRIRAGRSGGCPILALGITKRLLASDKH